jgi:hypothetical protein
MYRRGGDDKNGLHLSIMLINIIKHVQHASCHKDKTRIANEIKITNNIGDGMKFSSFFAFLSFSSLFRDFRTFILNLDEEMEARTASNLTNVETIRRDWTYDRSPPFVMKILSVLKQMFLQTPGWMKSTSSSCLPSCRKQWIEGINN